MSSNDRSELLNLGHGLPTTARDVAVLRELRYPSMTIEQYARFLAGFTTDRATLAAKQGPHGEPFALRRDAPR